MRGFDSCYPCLINQSFKKQNLLLSKNLCNALPKLALPQRQRWIGPISLLNSVPNNTLLINKAASSSRSSFYTPLKTSTVFNVSNKKRRLASKLALTKVFNFRSGLVFDNLSPALVSSTSKTSAVRSLAARHVGVAANINQPLWVLGDSNLYFCPKVSSSMIGSFASSLNNNFGRTSPAGGSTCSSTWFNKTLIDVASSLSGKKSLLQFYPFLSSSLSKRSVITYKSWVPRLLFYQKRLGHRFFMEESLHVMHTALNLHDATLFAGWLKSLIKRISFWKTRSIFRYLVYLFNNFFTRELESIGCKGLRIRLKGKISAAGNSRKRSISLSFGKVSYSTLDIKCLSDNTAISTFTGAMCLRTQIFY